MASESPDCSSSEQKSPTVCHLCRQRKTKCDRTLPRCGFCVKAKVNCKYVANPKKRGLRAGYVSQLESRLGSASPKHQAKGDWLTTPRIARTADRNSEAAKPVPSDWAHDCVASDTYACTDVRPCSDHPVTHANSSIPLPFEYHHRPCLQVTESHGFRRSGGRPDEFSSHLHVYLGRLVVQRNPALGTDPEPQLHASRSRGTAQSSHSH